MDAPASYVADDWAGEDSKPISKKGHRSGDSVLVTDAKPANPIAWRSPSTQKLSSGADSRTALRKFISKKGGNVSQETLDKVKIHSARSASKSGLEDSEYNVSYEYLGKVFDTKGDLYKALVSRRAKPAPALSSRAEAHAEARQRLLQTSLPLDPIHVSSSLELTVLALGSIQSTKHCSAVQLYPIGYKCSITANRNSASEAIASCEILEEKGSPLFCIESKLEGRLTGSSEVEVWNQVPMLR